jgi:hypothetical protein
MTFVINMCKRHEMELSDITLISFRSQALDFQFLIACPIHVPNLYKCYSASFFCCYSTQPLTPSLCHPIRFEGEREN